MLSLLQPMLTTFWGNIKPYATDPMAWLAALGTGLGAYDMIRRNQAEAEYLRRQRDWQRRVESIANAPLNVSEIFDPAKRYIQRELEAGLAERGIQPGGAYSAAMGEGMMRQWLAAADIARAQRAAQLSGLSGTAPVRPQYPAAGDTSALGKYLQYRAESQAAQRARASDEAWRQEILKILNRQVPGGPPTGQPPSQSLGLSFGSDVYSDLPLSEFPYSDRPGMGIGYGWD